MPRDLTDTERYEFDELNKTFRPGEVLQVKSHLCDEQTRIRALLARLDALSHQPESAAPAQPEPQVAQPTSAPTTASEALKEKARIEVIVQADGRIRMNSYSMGRCDVTWFPMDEKRFFDKALPMALLEARISAEAAELEADRAALAKLFASMRGSIAEQRRALEASAVISEQQVSLLEKAQQRLRELVRTDSAAPASECER